MRLATSYFYQIRNFTKSMIPISTAISDPTWFHDYYTYTYFDERGILNGLRCDEIAQAGKNACNVGACCPCKDKGQGNGTCAFLTTYRKNLDKIDFPKLYKDFEEIAKAYQITQNIKEEITIVLIVYESYKNPCSERKSLIDWVRSNGIECGELNYPIQKKIETRKPSLTQLLARVRQH